VIDVLYVEGCPNYRGALGLVERVRAELGIDAELRTTLIRDQAAADQAQFPGSPTVRVDDRDVEPGSEPPAEYTLACRLYRLEHRFAGQQTSAGCARRCCERRAEPEPPTPAWRPGPGDGE
jgi:hypothetical protein